MEVAGEPWRGLASTATASAPPHATALGTRPTCSPLSAFGTLVPTAMGQAVASRRPVSTGSHQTAGGGFPLREAVDPAIGYATEFVRVGGVSRVPRGLVV